MGDDPATEVPPVRETSGDSKHEVGPRHAAVLMQKTSGEESDLLNGNRRREEAKDSRGRVHQGD